MISHAPTRCLVRFERVLGAILLFLVSCAPTPFREIQLASGFGANPKARNITVIWDTVFRHAVTYRTGWLDDYCANRRKTWIIFVNTRNDHPQLEKALQDTEIIPQLEKLFILPSTAALTNQGFNVIPTQSLLQDENIKYTLSQGENIPGSITKCNT